MVGLIYFIHMHPNLGFHFHFFSEYYCFQSPHLPKFMTLLCSVLSTGTFRAKFVDGASYCISTYG